MIGVFALPLRYVVEPLTWIVTSWSFSTVSYGPVRATWTVMELPPIDPIVPPIQWQLHQTRMCVAVSDASVESAAVARRLTRSPAWMLESGTAVLSLPETICVSPLTATVTLWPFSCPSFGPVQSTVRLSESLPTDETEPANQ